MIALHRSYQSELLDEDCIPFKDIQRNMFELNIINTFLGGHAITIAGFKKLLGNKKSITVGEIGCGGGDNLVAIARWCKKNQIAFKGIGIDIKEDCIQIAKRNTVLEENTEWICSDYSKVIFIKKPDIIFSSLFCHHFKEEDIIEQLHWMKSNAVLGFFINDLHRHVLAYYSIRWITAIASTSFLVKHDAPLSVLRGWKKRDWLVLLQKAFINKYSIQWKWAFRYLIVVGIG